MNVTLEFPDIKSYMFFTEIGEIKMDKELDEAIKHAEEVAEEKCALKDYYSPEEHKCGKEHRQIAAWLRELKLYRKANLKIKDDINKLESLSIEDGSDGIDEYVDKFDTLKIIDKHLSEVEGSNIDN